MTLAHYINAMIALGQDPRVPHPPHVEDLWALARSARLPVRELVTLRRPLALTVRGTYDLVSGDTFLVVSDDPTEDRRVLLHELGHAARRDHWHRPETIEEDWAEEAAAWRAAYELGQRWRLHVLSAEELEDELQRVEELRAAHEVAAELVGATDPGVARSAYQALLAMAQEQGWDHETLQQALWANPPAGAPPLVDLDRTFLRASWSLPISGASGWEEIALPRDDTSARFLESALRQLTRRPPPALGDRWMGTVEDDNDLVRALGWLNYALWQLPDAPALVHATIYIGETLRLIHVNVRYQADFQASGWIACSTRRHRGQILCAALERYLASYRHIEKRWLALDVGILEMIQEQAYLDRGAGA